MAIRQAAGPRHIGRIGARLGIADQLPARRLKLIFAIFLLHAARSMLLKPSATPLRNATQDMRGFVRAGAVIGGLSSILGIGRLSVPFLVRRGYPVQSAVGISAACGFPIAIAGTAAYIAIGWPHPGLPAGSFGYIYLPAVAGLCLGSAPGAPLGARLAHRWPTRWLRRVLGWVVALAGGKLLWQAFP